MEIIASEPELLNGAQTFIGVLITLLVLCLFHDKNTNFMLRIVVNMIDDFLSSVKHSVDRMREDLKDYSGKSRNEQLAFADYHWLSQSKKYPEIHQKLLVVTESSEDAIMQFFNSNSSYIERLKLIQKKVDDKSEHELVSHVMMLLLMVVMTMDAIGVSVGFGSVFLFFLMLYSSVFFLYLWVQYLNFKSPVPEKKIYHTRRTRTLAPISFVVLLLSLASWIALSSLTTLCFKYYLLWSALILALPIVLVSACVSSGFCQSERYNKKFVTNHMIYIFFTSTLMALCVYAISNCGLPFVSSECSDLQTNWQRYIVLFNDNISGIRTAFVLYSVLNAFFIPIFAVFLYYQFNTLMIKAVMMIKKRKVSKALSANRVQFVDLVHEMLAKEKNETKQEGL